MDLSSLVDSDLVAGADAQTRVVVGAVVHKTLASGRVGLLIEGTRNRELGSNTSLEVVLI